MAYGFVPIIHIVAVVFSIIELGLTAYDVSKWSHFWSTAPSQINFMLFNAIWSLLVLAYVGITPLYFTSVFHRLVALGLEVVTMIFWFAGSIALAVAYGGPYDCHADTYCGSMEASIAFGFFLWALFVALVVIDTIESLRSRGHHTTVHKEHHHHHTAAPYAGA